MISCQNFFDLLKKKGISFFTGIPDSTFKEFMKFIADNDSTNLQNLVPCNECEAIALASGYHLATGKIGTVYMQNSGLGKAINPLTSLCDTEVYSIPLLLLIGWRGEPGKIDAPQHKKMGRIMLSLLDTLQIPYYILEPDLTIIKKELEKAFNYFKKNKAAYAFIIKGNFFQNYEMRKKQINNYTLKRKEVIRDIMKNLTNNEIIVSTTGYISRELFEYKESGNKEHFRSFYNVGAMGCASSIGLSIALQKPNKKVIVFDGDGAAIMQMGAFSTIGKYSPSNYVHIIFDNQAHETTGGQPTNSSTTDLLQVALASNYKSGKIIKTKEELINSILEIKEQEGPILLLIKLAKSSPQNLKRPDKDLKRYKEEIMNYLINTKK